MASHGGNTALELLTNRETERIEPWINKIWGPFLGGSIGLIAAVLINFGTRRPVYSGIYKHIGLTAGGATTLYFVSKHRLEYYAERDAVYKHYVELHPEDFSMPERKKYGESLLTWVPIR